MKTPYLMLLVALCSLISACDDEFDLGIPILGQSSENEDSPLTFCKTPIPLSPIVTSGFGFNLENTRNQPSTINAATLAASGLNLKYTLVDEHEVTRRGAPAATKDVLYYTGVDTVYAMDRATGCAYWTYEPDEKYGPLRSTAVLLVDNDAFLSKRTVMVGTARGQVIAMDAQTGKATWKTFAGNRQSITLSGKIKTKSMITGGLQYHDGRVYVPLASQEVADAVLQPKCCKSHGLVTALDAIDGDIIWKYQATAKATMRNFNWSKWGPNGVSIWSTPLIDIDNNQILFGTSQNFTKPLTANSDAVVALNLDTGKEKWVFKGTSEDYYNSSCGLDNAPFDHCASPSLDFDMITPILVKKTTNNGLSNDIIIAADKGGTVYSLNPITGAKIWERNIGAGGLLGGVHWAMAVDDKHVYAGVADFKVPKAAILGNSLADLLELQPEQVEGARPGVYAINLSTGIVAWEVHPQNGDYDAIYSAPLTVTNDVLFAGSLDGTIRAFDLRTGKEGNELWSYYTAVETTDIQGREGNGGAIDSIGPVIAGNQLLLNSGYSVFNISGKNPWQGGPGNAIFVFESL